MIISRVFNFAYGAVGLDQRVVAMYGVTVAALVLGLMVAGVGVSY